MPRHSVSVAGAIINGGGCILTIRHRDNGHWEPQGDLLESEEAVEEGLVREIREETGLHRRSRAPDRLYKNMAQGVVALVFRCSVSEAPTVRTDGKATELTWRTVDEVGRRMDEAYATLSSVSLQ